MDAASGVAFYYDERGRSFDLPTYTCRCCGMPFVVPMGKSLPDVAQHCHHCGWICARCAKGRHNEVTVRLSDGRIDRFYECLPFIEQVEHAERRYRQYREMGLVE